MRSALLLFVPCSILACASSDPAEGVQSAEVVSGMNARPSDPCTAEIVFLQKDAYRNGRSNEYWPPHTTTVLEVTCQTATGEQKIAPYRENFGTPPGRKDANGNDMLTKVTMDPRVVTTTAPWSEMQKLVASYSSCGCDPAGFLGLDTIDVEGQVIVEKLMPVLACPDGFEDALLLAIKEKRFDDAKGLIGKCNVRDDASPVEIAKAAAAFESAVRETLSQHHVCNNSVVLQADLFQRFRDHQDATACSAQSRACFGPKMYYNPVKEVR